MSEQEYVNECGSVVATLRLNELFDVIKELDDKELRRKFLHLLVGMYESQVTELKIVYPPVRGKQ